MYVQQIQKPLHRRIWFYWGCNPLSYAQKGMAVNEFRAPRWQGIYTDSSRSQTVGDAVLAQRGLPRNGYNRALAFCVLVGVRPCPTLCNEQCSDNLAGKHLSGSTGAGGVMCCHASKNEEKTPMSF